MLVNERNLASATFGCDETVMRNIFFDILRDNQETPNKASFECSKGCQCSKHLFVKTDNTLLKGEKEILKEQKMEEEFYSVPGSGDHGLYSLKRRKNIYFPKVEYSYRFFQCLECKRTFIWIKMGNDGQEVILDCHVKEPTPEEILDLQLFGNLHPRKLEYDVADDYEIIDFTDIFSKISLLCKDQEANPSEIEKLLDKIAKKVEESSSPDETETSLNQLKQECLEKIEQNEMYKRLLNFNQDFLKWLK